MRRAEREREFLEVSLRKSDLDEDAKRRFVEKAEAAHFANNPSTVPFNRAKAVDDFWAQNDG